MKPKVKRLDISKRRVLCVSDIHGNYDLLDKLLKRNNYNKDEDYLFILGDISRKGNYPLKTLRYVMKLAKNENVVVTMGNCDEADYLDFLPQSLEWFKKFMHSKNLIHDFLYEKYHTENFPELSDEELLKLQEEFINTEEIKFIRNLYHVIDTEKFFFTHAKMPKEFDLENNDYHEFIQGRSFYTDGHNIDKTVVVGHMPTTIFVNNYYDNSVLFDESRKFIMIDGGMVVHRGGQINLLEIKDNVPRFIDHIDSLEERIVLKDQISPMSAKGTCWPYYNIEILQKKKHFSICKIPETLEVCLIKNEMIANDGLSTIDDCPGMLLDVKKNDIVKLVEEFPGYSLIKKNSQLGWIKNEYLGEKNEIK